MGLTSLTIETCPEELTPADNLCIDCKHAIWYQLPKSLHCQCTLRGSECYTSATPRKVVKHCDGPGKSSGLAHLIVQRDAQVDMDHPNSVTFDELPLNRLPQGRTACANCPSAVWYALPDETHCDCLLLHAEAYTSDHPSARIERCDGVLISTLQLLQKKQR